MTDFAPISSVSSGSTDDSIVVLGGRANPVHDERSSSRAREAKRYLARLKAMPLIRADLVRAVRARIDAGTYETPARLRGAVNELFVDLADESGR